MQLILLLFALLAAGKKDNKFLDSVLDMATGLCADGGGNIDGIFDRMQNAPSCGNFPPYPLAPIEGVACDDIIFALSKYLALGE